MAVVCNDRSFADNMVDPEAAELERLRRKWDSDGAVDSASSTRPATPATPKGVPMMAAAAEVAFARRESARMGCSWPAELPAAGRATASRPGTAARDSGLVAASASGSLEEVRRILKSGVAPTEVGPDGTTPLCAAAMWGHVEVVELLLAEGAEPGQPNCSGSRPTPLHAAALQEHGKICMRLLAAGADPRMLDASDAAPVDYASCSEAIWPHFAARGCERVCKKDLVQKGVIRKASSMLEQELGASDGPKAMQGLLPEFSRPGSSYVVTTHFPPRPGSAAVPRRASSTGRLGSASRPGSRAATRPIDILSEMSLGGAIPGAGPPSRRASGSSKKQSSRPGSGLSRPGSGLGRSASLASLGL